ncbi:hypothetical protein [Haloplanus halobius]|uniref:hypothetical protein n=1 Tax=Haloplanus halobius TaxID=2934938 RepID=UPI00200F7723|nr:hypothetical protein [Haloplanus sp. XH21]
MGSKGVETDGVIDWLTIHYARWTHRKILDIQEYSAEGVEDSIYWYNSDSNRGGHCTPFNTILMNQNPLEEVSKKVTDYVFLHESGHANQHPILRVMLYAALFPTIIMAIAAPFFAVAQTISVFVLTESLRLTALKGAASLIVVGITTSAFGLVSWIDEGYAELFALNRLGKETYLQSHQEIREHADRPIYRKIIHRVRYPFPCFIVWISENLR